MSDELNVLPRGSLAALEKAVRMAAEWRGYYIHDADALAAFDEDIKRARAALAAVRKQNRSMANVIKLAMGRLMGFSSNAVH